VKASLKQEQTQLLTLVAEERERQRETLDSQVNAQKKLVEAQEQRALAAQTALNISQKEMQRNQEQVSKLTMQLTRLKLDLEEQQELALRKDELLSSLQPTVEAKEVQAQLDALVAENARLKDDAARLVERYREGNLVRFSVFLSTRYGAYAPSRPMSRRL
jgi:hypothetical protein